MEKEVKPAVTAKDLVEDLLKHPPKTAVVQATNPECDDFYPVGYVKYGWWQPGEGFGVFHSDDEVTDPTFSWEPDENSIRVICIIPED